MYEGWEDSSEGKCLPSIPKGTWFDPSTTKNFKKEGTRREEEEKCTEQVNL
jgi:hypothetical protein